MDKRVNDGEYIYTVCRKVCAQMRIYDEDFVHDLYIIVHDSLPNMFSGSIYDGRFYTWVLYIAKNRYINKISRVKSRSNGGYHKLWIFDDSENDLRRKIWIEESLSKIDSIIRGYPVRWQIVFGEKIKGYTLKEIAKNCGFTTGSTNQAYRNLKKRLKKDLKGLNFEYV